MECRESKGSKHPKNGVCKAWKVPVHSLVPHIEGVLGGKVCFLWPLLENRTTSIRNTRMRAPKFEPSIQYCIRTWLARKSVVDLCSYKISEFSLTFSVLLAKRLCSRSWTWQKQNLPLTQNTCTPTSNSNVESPYPSAVQVQCKFFSSRCFPGRSLRMDASTGSSPSPLPESPLKVLADTLIRLKETPTAENAVLCRAHKLPRTFNPHEVPSGLRNGNLDVVVTEFYNRKGFRKCSIPGCNDSHTNFKTIIVRNPHPFVIFVLELYS